MSIIPVNEALSIKAAKLKEFNDGSSARLKAAEDRFNEKVKCVSHDSTFIYIDMDNYISGWVQGRPVYKSTNLTELEFKQHVKDIEAAGYFVVNCGLSYYKAYFHKPKLGFFGL